ncbi:MAG: major facilitator superfamily 1, partial [Armatimonadetes bacterium]|nr:major facilitator superfamily 1 [Armatimonadota bacterium]
VLALPQAWILIVARFLTDASWYLVVFWMMLYFQNGRGFSDGMVAQYGWIPFGTADLGALFGGWFSSMLIRRGMGTAQARSVSMFSFALLMVFTLVGFLVPANAPYWALACFSIATFGHMAWGTNQLTLHSDLFPEERVATIMGITGAAGSLGGVVSGTVVGLLVDRMGGSYLPVFICTAALHPIAATLVLLRVGKLTRPEAS